MAEVEVGQYRAKVPEGRSITTNGGVRSAYFEPQGSELWSATATMTPGATITWEGDHGDEAIYIDRGEVRTDDQIVGPGDVVIIEAGVLATIEARTDATLVLFGPKRHEPPTHGAFGPPALEGRGVHVRRAADLPVLPHPGYWRQLYADSTCPTCRITLFSVTGEEGYSTGSHLHSEDEIIHVLEGELQVGRLAVGPNSGLAVPGNQRYGFRARTSFRFLNYRRDVSTYTGTPGSQPVLETVLQAMRNAGGT